jgi:hypothetical protein
VIQQFVLPKLMNRASASQRIGRILASLPMGTAYRIEVHEQKDTRSTQQNRYLFGVVYETILRDGGEAMRGWTRDDLHEFFLIDHFGSEVSELFGRKRLKPLRRSSRLNKQEFSDFIAHIQQFMAERGVFIPDADQEEAA